MIEIKRWDNGEVIHSGDFASVKECLEDGVSKGVSFYCADLNNAELTGAVLNGANLTCAELNNAMLTGASLIRAKLNGAELNNAMLTGASLIRAKLNNSVLKGAKLNNSMLTGAELNGAELNNAMLTGASLRSAHLTSAKLSKNSVSIPSGMEYYLFISPQVVQVGCKSFSPDEWRKMTMDQIKEMEGSKSVKFYPKLLDVMDFFLGEGERPEWVKK